MQNHYSTSQQAYILQEKALSLIDMATILIVDDDRSFREILSSSLIERGFTVVEAQNTLEAMKAIETQPIHLILLDVMMPEEDGITFCKRLRKEHNTPVIFISALTDEIEQILALEVGGLYYVTKPFSTRLLITKIKKALELTELFQSASDVDKNSNEPKANIEITTSKNYYFNELIFNPYTRRLTNKKNKQNFVKLGVKERDLLVLLIQNIGIPLQKEFLMKTLYNKEFDLFDNSVNSLVYRLRKKINECLSRPSDLIQSAYTNGYQLIETPEESE